MDEKPDQIIGHIDAQRHELGRNLSELESRVRASTNWRTYYEKNPMLAVGAALGGGILLGTMMSSGRRSSSSSSSSSYRPAPTHSRSSVSSPASAAGTSSASSLVSSPVTAMERRHVSETFDHIKAALIGFGVAKAKEFLNQAIPGLEPHLSEAEQRGRQHSNVPSSSQSWQSPGSTAQRPAGESHSWESAGASHHDPVPAM
jgi:hypothetical protein